jgi:pimeloyl-ACP methyl ester carboxylesterase
MATYVLIHGSGGDGRYWYRVVPELGKRGHDVLAPDLPVDDDSAGLEEYADLVVDAIGERGNVILVAQSLAGFIAPLVAERVPTELIVLVAAMIPKPGESAGQWWGDTGHDAAKLKADIREGRDPDAAFDPVETFLHDLPPDILAEALAEPPKPQSGAIFGPPWPLKAWPDVPTRFVLCTQDRFFPAEFMRHHVKQRLGITPDEIDSGHLPALSRPVELVERLEAYRVEIEKKS